MKDTFKYQGVAGPSEMAAYLRALAEGLSRGEITVTENERSFSLNPRGLLDFTLKVRRKDGRSRFLMAVAWDEDAARAPLFDGLEEGAPQ